MIIALRCRADGTRSVQSDRQLVQASSKALGQQMTLFAHLTHLSLMDCDITFAELSALAVAVENAPKLEALDLSGNPLSQHGSQDDSWGLQLQCAFWCAFQALARTLMSSAANNPASLSQRSVAVAAMRSEHLQGVVLCRQCPNPPLGRAEQRLHLSNPTCLLQ